MPEDNTLLTANAVREIERLTAEALGETVEIDDVVYTTRQVFDPRRPEPLPDPVEVATLQSFVELVKDATDNDGDYRRGRGLFVHVEGPTEVDLWTGIFGEFHQRAHLAGARAIVPDLKLERFLDPELFVIELQCKFEPTDDRAKVFQVAGNLQAELVQTVEDDGVSQRATARSGLVKVAKVDVPNPVQLTPFRSFPEVEQVTSPFVLRLQGGAGKPPSCALFEADGGRWRLEAIRCVKEWLAGELGDSVPVYG